MLRPRGTLRTVELDDLHDVQLLETPLDADTAARAAAHADAGGAVLVVPTQNDPLAAELCGVDIVDHLPTTEWFVTLTDRPEARRLDGETPITSALTLLRPTHDDTVAAATTSVRFEHHPTITVRQRGAGRVVALGVTDVDAVRHHPTIGRFVARLLQGGVPSSPRTLGLGVVGYGPFGGMGYLHGLAATETDGLAFVAAADPVQARLDAARDDFADVAAYLDAESLAADPDVDIAVVATPPAHHAELATTLLRAGKHVVVEKPMCLDPADADALIATATEHDRVITVHQSRRWDRDVLALGALIAAGEIGDVFNIETFVGGFEHPCRAWHSEETISGGAVYDWGSHHVDWILQLFGQAPQRVMCTTHQRVWHDSTNVDQLALWMQWPDGREATFRQSDICAIRRPKFHVEGTAGTIEGHYRPLRHDSVEPGRGHVEHTSHHAEAPVDLTMVRYGGANQLIESHHAPAAHPGWGFHHNLADHLQFDEPLAVPPEQSRDVVRVLEAGHRSGASGGVPIELG
ncbi:MAG: Gfo/Idh/MocA family oxidoreductase [Ilumatobacteraceae bacterium]|nr:Gfo/Idh/MocA family oxidoreductase [Ilumatobacteraceae bacterium]